MPRNLLHDRVTVVWAGLVAATGVSFVVGFGLALHGQTAKTIGSAIALSIAFVKVRFIGAYFMELRTAPLALRVLFDLWVIGVGGTVTLMFILSQ